MRLESVKFNTAEGTLELLFVDGRVEVFTDRAALAEAYPEYERFADGMGW